MRGIQINAARMAAEWFQFHNKRITFLTHQHFFLKNSRDVAFPPQNLKGRITRTSLRGRDWPIRLTYRRPGYRWAYRKLPFHDNRAVKTSAERHFVILQLTLESRSAKQLDIALLSLFENKCYVTAFGWSDEANSWCFWGGQRPPHSPTIDRPNLLHWRRSMFDCGFWVKIFTIYINKVDGRNECRGCCFCCCVGVAFFCVRNSTVWQVKMLFIFKQ